MDHEEREPWERLPAESATDYRAFKAYLDLPAGHGRSLKALSEIVDVDRTNLWRLFNTHAWIPRAQAWDRDIGIKSIARLQEEQIEANVHYRVIARKASEKLLTAITDFDPAELKVSDIASLMKVCFSIERLALGIPDAVRPVELSGPGGGPVQMIAGPLTTAERRAALSDAVSVAQERLAKISTVVDIVVDVEDVEEVPDDPLFDGPAVHL